MLRAKAIWVESDSKTVDKWLKYMRCPLLWDVGLLADLREWIFTLVAFQVSHVFREANTPADWFPNLGRKGAE